MVRNYAAQTPSYIATHYEVANNHILLSLLLHAIDALSPKRLMMTLADPGLLQLPSILASVGALVLLYDLGLLLFSPAAALAAMAALGLSFWHLMYSHMLRGYSLATFFCLLSAWLAAHALLRGRRSLLSLLPLTLLAAHYIVPSSVIFTLALGLWAVWLSRQAEYRQESPSLKELAAVFGCGLLLTLLSYLPVLDQLPNAGIGRLGLGESLLATPRRLGLMAGVLGRGWLFPSFFLIAGVAGAVVGWRRGSRPGVVLALLQLAVPLVAATLTGTMPETRVYLYTLPFWALLLAAGTPAAAGQRAAALLLFAGLSWSQVSSFRAWNRGFDPRAVVLEVSARTVQADDFVLIYTSVGDRDLGDVFDWSYYGFCADLEPFLYLRPDQDLPYLSRARYYIAAGSQEEAAAALERSGADRFVRRTLRLAKSMGRVGLYEAGVGDAVLAAYESAAKSAAGSEQAEALIGLAVLELKYDRPARALPLLERAARLAPSHPKLRFYSGLARALTLDEEGARREFQWLVLHDRENVHAPMLLGDALASLGRFEEARRWYRWYQEPVRPAAAWAFLARSRAALKALDDRWKPLAGRPQGAPQWRERAKLFLKLWSFERAVGAQAEAVRLDPTLQNGAELAYLRSLHHQYAAAAGLLQAAVAGGAGDPARILLARELMIKRAYGMARRELEGVLSRSPDDADARQVLEELKRLE